jgi:hypothetical protein
MNNRAQVNATAFSMETDGCKRYITQSPTELAHVVYNATIPAKRLGFDLNVIAKLTPNLTLNFRLYD